MYIEFDNQLVDITNCKIRLNKNANLVVLQRPLISSARYIHSQYNSYSLIRTENEYEEINEKYDTLDKAKERYYMIKKILIPQNNFREIINKEDLKKIDSYHNYLMKFESCFARYREKLRRIDEFRDEELAKESLDHAMKLCKVLEEDYRNE